MEQKNKRYRSLSAIFFFLVGITLSASLVGAYFRPESSLERISNEGGIKITARYMPRESNTTEETIFRLKLNTHNVDLSEYDLKKRSFISINKGPLQQAKDWTVSGGGHHIQGILKFARNQVQATRHVQLIVKGIGDSNDRVFEWKAPIDRGELRSDRDALYPEV